MPFAVDIRPQKDMLRKGIKEKRKSLSFEEKARRDKKISNKLYSLWQYREANVILTYVSTDNEVDTRCIIETALNAKKKVAVPFCVPNTPHLMKFYFINSLSQLEKGSFGVLEPNPNICEELKDFSNGLCLVPALSFDKKGYRLGYGKGYYDRFLSKFDGKTVGLCYEEFLSEELPNGKYDKQVQTIITDREIIKTI